MERKEIAQRYSQAFKPLDAIRIPNVKPDRESAWHLYVITLNPEALTIDRNRFINELKQRGIGSSVHFIPLHRHPFYRNTFGYNAADFPVSEWLYERIISLPVYPGMTDGDVDFVIESVTDVCRKFKR